MSAPERVRPPIVRPPNEQRGGSRLRAILATVIVLVLVIVGAFLGVLKFLGSRTTTVLVAIESVSSAGANPFMTPAGTDVAVPALAGASTTASGSSAGLYGAIRNNSSCDSPAMVQYLGANEAKASAWAAILKIEAPAIPAYVAELTPALLRTDTYVTNPGFRVGQASALVSVLQAGTAVLVDKFGTPRVKCYSGNPLDPATAPSTPKFIGKPWPGFDADKIAVIEPNATPLSAFTMVNPNTGEVIERPVGTTGAGDRVITSGRADQQQVAAPPKPAPAPRINNARAPARVAPTTKAVAPAPAVPRPPPPAPPPTKKPPLLPGL